MVEKRLMPSKGIIYVLKSADHQAGVDGDSFTMKLNHHATIVFLFGALTGDAVLKVYSGATDAAKTTSMAFKHLLASGDQGAVNADKFGAEATVVAANGLTLTAATYDNRTLVVEIEESMLADGEPWVTLELSSAASTLNVSALALVSPRFARQDIETSI